MLSYFYSQKTKTRIEYRKIPDAILPIALKALRKQSTYGIKIKVISKLVTIVSLPLRRHMSQANRLTLLVVIQGSFRCYTTQPGPTRQLHVNDLSTRITEWGYKDGKSSLCRVGA